MENKHKPIDLPDVIRITADLEEGEHDATLVEVKPERGNFKIDMRCVFRPSGGRDKSYWFPVATLEGKPLCNGPNSKTGRALAALKGGPVEKNDKVRPKDYVGETYKIKVVKKGDKLVITSFERISVSDIPF